MKKTLSSTKYAPRIKKPIIKAKKKSKEIIKNDDKSKHAIRQLYKEKTHVFPYFILKAILMNNYANFVLWCDQMNINISICQFKITDNKKENISKAKYYIEKAPSKSSFIVLP